MDMCDTEGCDRTDGLTRWTGPNGAFMRCEPCSHAWAEGYEAGAEMGTYRERYGD